MEVSQKARRALDLRDWKETSVIWEKLVSHMGFTMIRVWSCNKVPNEGKGWQQIDHRPFHKIGFDIKDNAGVVTGGKSGVIVLDVDAPEAFTIACQAHGWSLPETFSVITGKGFHYYYRLPRDGRNYRNRSKKAEGWDIRADDGYVVAPGSVHPSGIVYQMADDRVLTEAPQWLLSESADSKEHTTGGRGHRIRALSNRTHMRADLPEINIDDLTITDFIYGTIVNGAKEGERSESIYLVVKALIEAGCEDDEIVAFFMAYPIGDKAREKDDPEGWVYDDIARIRVKMEGAGVVQDTPPVFPSRALDIPDLTLLDLEYQTLIEYAHRDLIEMIRSYGNVTSESQEEALKSLLHIYAAMADKKLTGRIAAPLPTGLGKTTSIVALLSRAYRMGMLGRGRRNFTVAVAASKVDQLCDLHDALVKAGVSEEYISLVHSYRYSVGVVRDSNGLLPEGYAARPASPDKHRPILLLSHNKVKNGPEHAFDDSLQKRTFIIWDESLISTESKALDVKRLAHGLNCYRQGLDDLRDELGFEDRRVDPTRMEIAENTWMHMSKVMDRIRDEVHSQRIGRPKEIIKFPHVNDTGLAEMIGAVEWVGEMQRVQEVRDLILYLKNLLRITENDTSVHLGKSDNNAVVRFDVVVPDTIANMVILDASARINTLMMLDQSIHLPSNLPELRLSYSGTVFHRIRHKEGRGGIEEELVTRQRNLLGCLIEIVNTHPGESVLFFTYKQREGEPHHREVIERYLMDNGVDTGRQIDGKPRFNWLTHGNETASNRYTHCSVAIFVGLLNLPREVSLSKTIAQGRDLTATVTEGMVTQVIRGMHSQAVHQGANRTASRTIENDQAKPVNVYYTYKTDALVPYLEQVLPEADFREYESAAMTVATRGEAGKIAVLRYLEGLARDIQSVSVRAIKEAVAELAKVGTATQTRIMSMIVNDPEVPWTRLGRSLVRV